MPPMSAATDCPGSSSRSATATTAPAWANALAVASPRPEAPPETKAPAPVKSIANSPGDDRHSGRARCPVELGIANFGSTRYLSIPGGIAQLQDQLVDLSKTRCPDRLAVGQEPAISVHWQRAVDLRSALGNQLLLLPVFTEAVLSHMDDLGSRVGVLKLDHINVFGAKASTLVRRLRRIRRRGILPLQWGRGTVHLEGSITTGTDLRSPDEDGIRGVPVGDVGLAEHDRRRPLIRAAEHVLGEWVVDDPRLCDLLHRKWGPPERVRVSCTISV